MAVPPNLMQVILDRTLEHKLRWNELSNTGFTSQIGENSIIIDRVSPGRYRLTITDERGSTLEQSDSGIRDDETFIKIYESARRQALHIEDSLVHLQRKLEEL